MRRTLGWLLLALAAASCAAAAADTVISPCTAPFTFGFLGWEKAKTMFPALVDGIHLTAKDGRGGAGMVSLNLPVDTLGDSTPALRLALGEHNQATTLNLHLADADGTSHTFKFDLRRLKPGPPQLLTADYGASLAVPQGIDKPGTTPGLGRLNLLMVIGDFSGNAVDLVLSGIVLVPATDELRAARAKLAELKAREAEQARQAAAAQQRARDELLAKGAPHPADGPEVTHLCAVAADVLAFTLQAGHHVNNELLAYTPEPGDEVVAEQQDKPRHTIRDGRVVDYYQRAVFRRVAGRRTRLGLLSPDGHTLFVEHASRGQQLDETVVDVPAAYRLSSADDPAYAEPRAPLAVYRKGKPNGFSQPLPFLYTLSLKLPTPLKEGASYTLRLHGVNSAQESVVYAHRPREVRSLALHAIQTGYRPDDPYKRAYLSFWMGVDAEGRHGSCTPEATTFELLDPAGHTVFTGRAEPVKQAGDTEQISIHEQVDYTKAAVRRLDFSAWRTPGEYRVHVPGLGTSDSFRVAADVWETPFKAALQGVLAQRQAVDLGPPFSRYTRRRPLHPDDGVQFYQLDIPQQAGQEGTRGERLLALARAGKLERTTIVAGAYQDAGDWDTIGHHLSATSDLLGLYDLNPTAFAQTRLALPPADLRGPLPPLLVEALWQLPTWQSLQQPDGGVRGGFGDGWGCYPGETSTMLTCAGVYTADHDTTLRYAAAAARAARVLTAFDPPRVAPLLESAKRAWAWAEAHAAPDDPVYQRVLSFDKSLPKTLRHRRAQAAVELFAATRDPAFDQAFHESTELTDTQALYLDQPESDFAYARLPAGLGDAALKQAAVARFVKYADHALAFSRKNAFEILAGHRTDMPMIFVSRFFSTPGAGGLNLIYAWELTHRPEYLAGAVQGANYSLGANPDNLSYCSGVGSRSEHFPFIVDAQVSGQFPDVPVGHIPFGQGNEGNAMSRGANGWVQTWLLNFGPTKKMTPNWYDWPVTEQYVDFGRYPLHNENCFDATSVPAACYWFWLHTRPITAPGPAAG